VGHPVSRGYKYGDLVLQVGGWAWGFVEMTGRSPLRRRRSALDCRAIEEEEEEEEEYLCKINITFKDLHNIKSYTCGHIYVSITTDAWFTITCETERSLILCNL
jgi:hypothetical protein